MTKLEDFLVGEKSFWNVIILFSILIVFITGMFITYQILSAKSYCNSINGEYSIELNKFPHHCNGEIIVKEEGKWDFLDNLIINWSNFQYKP